MTALTVDQVHFLEFLLGMWMNVPRSGTRFDGVELRPGPYEVRQALKLEFGAADRIYLGDVLRAKGLIL